MMIYDFLNLRSLNLGLIQIFGATKFRKFKDFLLIFGIYLARISVMFPKSSMMDVYVYMPTPLCSPNFDILMQLITIACHTFPKAFASTLCNLR